MDPIISKYAFLSQIIVFLYYSIHFFRTLQHLEKIAIQTAGNLASGTLKPKRERPLTERVVAAALKYSLVKDQIFKKAKAQVLKQTNGLYPAPLKVI